MHQSRKEQSIERASRRLLLTDRKEAMMLDEFDDEVEVAAEWAFGAMPAKRQSADQP
ncbi:conserved hypothetical protein [Paenibacillus curdlanolyticus YK9]|uniref:Uncharacterized protein n=1 Tax=Paenibacillus curdlanolyticus YK9 TaxID=717606 RepID=E0IDY9_9BACL|nr:hypothetical protein [Paenibacillus curdlanolyticus]EFM09343.1 conserved hypothetical protein [Paenibacillus curdlanolyticus YK9]